MSKDIRSFFMKNTKPADKNERNTLQIKKKPLPNLSDDDDFIPDSPAVAKKHIHKKRKIIDSDDEVEDKPKPKPEVKPKKVSAVKPSDIFGKDPVKRTKVDKGEKNTSVPKESHKNELDNKEKKVHSKESFKETLKQESDNFKALEKIVDDSDKKPHNSDLKSPIKTHQHCNGSEKNKLENYVKDEKHNKKSPSKKGNSKMKEAEVKPTKQDEIKNKSPSKKVKESLPLSKTNENALSKTAIKRDFSEFITDHNETSVESQSPPKSAKKSKRDKSPELTEEERMERKRYSATLYKSYLNRSGPKNPGSKEVPKGKENCLSGLSFLITGELESMDRSEITDIIKKYGADVKSGISGKVSYVICGEDAGPAKLAKAEKLNIPLLTEDEFLQLIKDRSSKDSSRSDKSPVKKVSHGQSSGDKKEEKSRTKEKKTPIKEKKIPVKENKENSRVEKISPMEVEVQRSVVEEKSGKTAIANSSMSWVDKYKPQSLKAIIGQQGDASSVAKLHKWLSNWYKCRKLKLPKPTPWSKGDGGYYRAALLSGPPGVGKTTTVSLVCKELGFDIVEYNASDTRSKSLLADKLSTQMSTTSLMPYFKGKTGRGAVTKKHVIIMDEVDGMAGNEDRGGMQELISMAKQTSVPIICMCNDKTSPKMRSFLNYCYDLTFPKPKVEQIKAAMRSICFKEGISIPVNTLHDLIVGANQDIRQTINLLSLWSASDNKDITDCAKNVKKDTKMGPWDVVRKVFTAEEHKTMSIHDKSDLFFYDYSLAPLFVQQNYLKVVPHCPKKEFLDRFAEAADSLSIGDLVESKIRGNMAWNLLPVQAMFSSVIPGSILSGHIGGQIDFPSWLGQNSKTNKMHRLVQELHSHTSLSTSGSKEAMKLDYAPHLRNSILRPLIDKGSEGIHDSIDFLQSYHLLRDDLDSLIELTHWSGTKDPLAMLDSKIKAAFTRTYNKEAAPLPYSQISIKKSRQNDDVLESIVDGEPQDEEKESSDVENDAMIKVPKKKSRNKSEDQKKTKEKDKKSKSKK